MIEKRTQMEYLEMKNKISKMKNKPLDEINIRLDTAKEKDHST